MVIDKQIGRSERQTDSEIQRGREGLRVLEDEIDRQMKRQTESERERERKRLKWVGGDNCYCEKATGCGGLYFHI